MTTIDMKTIAAERIALTNSQASFLLAFSQVLGKNRNERRADGSFADESTYDVGNSERDGVGIGEISGAEKRCDSVVTNVSEDPADNG